jgi:hypothetical protein
MTYDYEIIATGQIIQVEQRITELPYGNEGETSSAHHESISRYRRS